MKNLRDILKRKAIYRKEAVKAVESSVVKFLKKHPIMTKISWQHGEQYNDETYDYRFSNLKFMTVEPLHSQLWNDKSWIEEDERANEAFPVIPGRYEQQWYKTEEELPEAYADGKLASAIEDLEALNEEFLELGAELMEIFSTADEDEDVITITKDGII